jgi:EAL domain-containing protein (putative c-di-GMP-specific phosphodiesterase class I)
LHRGKNVPAKNTPPSTELLLETGEFLYEEGDSVDCGYIVESGELIIFSNKSGERVDLERRGPGSIIGELSILTGQPRAVTVEATQPCKVYRISAQQILQRFDKLDPVLRACIDTSINFMGRLNAPNVGAETPLTPFKLENLGELVERFKLEQDILTGLENQEFSIVYQPIVSLENSEMIGVEALMRWNHPELGFVPPDKFIQVAESAGSICKLTDFALMQSCAALKRFRNLNGCREDFFTTVNISGEDISRPEFFDFLAHVLDLNSLEPRHVRLEVTETALVMNSDLVTETLRRLRELGVGIAIDDFGTGYSNLAYLGKLPLTALKIDRAFAGDAYANPVSHSIVKMMINLGHELRVKVVAEGLETPEDVQTLRDMGCDYAQGYYFAKPMAEGDLSDMIAYNKGNRRNVA